MDNRTIGQVAYEGYRSNSGGKSLVSGALIPEWNQLSAAIKNAWEAAGDALVTFMGCSEMASATTKVHHE